jgi:large subunit ribosomal protein L24
MKIKKGDKIKVVAGKDNGREGTVEKVYEKKNAVLVPGINLYKKHVRKNDQLPRAESWKSRERSI